MRKFCIASVCLFIIVRSLATLPPGRTLVPGQSVYRLRPQDPKAIYFTPDQYKITADGRTDVSDALQAAIRTVKTRYKFGVVFIPEGKYLITKTIYIPTAVRLIGYGKTRPLFILGANSPGFQQADSADKGHAHYMFWFVSNLSQPGGPIYDAGASTFYSALSNINLRIEDGNPAAVALRTHFAQHSYIAHCDIDAGHAVAGLYDVGNEMEDVRFFGGDYGIYTTKPSPGWPYMMVDTWFEGQRLAAIRTHEAGLTIVRLQARNVPVVIDIDSNYHEKLFMEDCRFDDISQTAIRISNEDNAAGQINLRNIACRNTPVLTVGRISGKEITTSSPVYLVRRLTSGLQLSDWKAEPSYATTSDIVPLSAFPNPAPSDIPALPDMGQWANIQSLGAKGDGITDDTKAIREAIDSHPVLYFPQGWYRLTAPLHLKPNSVLIGLSPIATQLLITDNTPAFGGFGGPQPMVETPRGGNNILTGIGLSTGASNPRAVACKWQSGAGSYMNDVKFIGGHGSLAPGPDFLPAPAPPASAVGKTSAAGRDRTPGGDRDWDTQYWSLWITGNGGGTFKDIWTANTYASAGVYISHTITPGHIYALSVEHHVRNEIRFNAVRHWKVYALQLEEESRESSECQPMELQDCHNMVFANLYMFRVIRVDRPYPWSIRRWGGDSLEFLNVHNYSQTPYTTTVPLYDVDANSEIRPWEFARLWIGQAPQANPIESAQPQQLFTGAEFAQSPCHDSKGNIYFCESRMRRIYRWSPATRRTTLVADYPWQPLSIACDKKDNLLVVFKYVPKPGTGETFSNPPDAAGTSFSGWGNSGYAVWAYAIDPNNPDETIHLLPTIPMGSIHPGVALYPAHRWRDYHDFNTVSVARPEHCFLAPDSSTIIPIVYDLARSTSLAIATPGQPLYTTDEYDKRTVRLEVDPQGFLSHLSYFAERGEFASTKDSRGNVYIADGQIYMYDSAGALLSTLKTPERPTGITFGVPPAEPAPGNPTTLFVTGHHSLFTVMINR